MFLYRIAICGGEPSIVRENGAMLCRVLEARRFQRNTGFCVSGFSAAASVKIPEGVETIGAMAFQRCNFQEIALPESLTDIGADAFANCPSLESVTFPARNYNDRDRCV